MQISGMCLCAMSIMIMIDRLSQRSALSGTLQIQFPVTLQLRHKKTKQKLSRQKWNIRKDSGSFSFFLIFHQNWTKQIENSKRILFPTNGITFEL